jgi:hypothetical protein
MGICRQVQQMAVPGRASAFRVGAKITGKRLFGWRPKGRVTGSAGLFV